MRKRDGGGGRERERKREKEGVKRKDCGRMRM